jgi:hypothetical protein
MSIIKFNIWNNIGQLISLQFYYFILISLRLIQYTYRSGFLGNLWNFNSACLWVEEHPKEKHALDVGIFTANENAIQETEHNHVHPNNMVYYIGGTLHLKMEQKFKIHNDINSKSKLTVNAFHAFHQDCSL